MFKCINQKIDLRIFHLAALHFMIVLSAHAANPASKDYVDAQVNRINTEITQMESKLVAIPAGGSTGEVLAKASNSNYDTQWVNISNGGSLYTIGQHVGTDVIFSVYQDAAGIDRALLAAPTDQIMGDWFYAMVECANKNDGGYTWFLPDKDQIVAMYNNRLAIDPNALNHNGGFQTIAYWCNGVAGCVCDFNTGYVGSIAPGLNYALRCIRSV